MADTHFSQIAGKKRVIDETLQARPAEPQTGDFYWDSATNRMVVYNSTQWFYAQFTTTTSTSTSTTSTSTSTTSTTTSTSSSTSSSTSTTTSTTTSL